MMRPEMRGIAVATLLLLVATARADGLSGEDLAKKNEGGYFTGLPLAAYSTDLGFGGGVRVYYYWDGDRDDPRFAQTPYLYRVFAQAFASTRGLQFHWLDFDAPKFADTPYRLRGELIYERNINQNYFGLGNRALQPLAFPGSAKTYSNYDAYNTDQQLVDPNGNAWGKYDQYDLLRPLFLASIERLFYDGRLRVLAGTGFSWARINDYSGKTIDAVDATGAATTAPEGQTRLDADCAAKLIVGCGGGFDNFLRLGVSYDTRDFEPDPNKGVFLDGAIDAGTVALGSQYNYVRAMVAARGYYSPIPDLADLVLAGRAVFEVQTDGTPFFSMDTFPFTEDPRSGLGGHRTMRGYRQDRFVGPVMTLLNAEVRYTWGHITVLHQKLAFIVAPFLDIGRPYSSLSDLTYRDWKPSYGGAFRITWNLATVITVDYGVSPEDSGLYINFNHIF
jgi:outer membrane protein assembly factor BamA